ncbi:hypothetical protein ID866_6077 [Astraeus odoratus]|nr:hypothetical protein ID866_6077 [Astraeus odoratus]
MNGTPTPFAYAKLPQTTPPMNVFNTIVCLTSVLAFCLAIRLTRRRLRATDLRGPSSRSIIFGVGEDLLDSSDPGAVYEAWAREYGGVYEIPMALGERRTVLCDPKAITHFFSKDTSTYVGTPMVKAAILRGVGKGVLWADGEIHRRQRRSMAPAFNSAAIRKLTPVFHHIAYKVKSLWDTIIDCDDGGNAIIEVQDWMNHISLDTIGLAGFSHDFGTLDGKRGPISMKAVLVAAYETTSISLTWALLELARNPDMQTRLREELLEFGGEPTYDQFCKDLPYLDAVVHEIFRLHPAGPEIIRQAQEDDVIPLSEPVLTKSGTLVNSVLVTRGTLVSVSFTSTNRSEAIWGPDAKVFRPDRWLQPDGITDKAREIQGYRHLLTFGDGPKICLGRYFAVMEIKVDHSPRMLVSSLTMATPGLQIVLAVLVQNFVFEMRDGPGTKIEIGKGLLPRPRVAGEDGTKMPMRVRRYEG